MQQKVTEDIADSLLCVLAAQEACKRARIGVKCTSVNGS